MSGYVGPTRDDSLDGVKILGAGDITSGPIFDMLRNIGPDMVLIPCEIPEIQDALRFIERESGIDCSGFVAIQSRAALPEPVAVLQKDRHDPYNWFRQFEKRKRV